jgi:DNA polymerase-3 subunit epsilon
MIALIKWLFNKGAIVNEDNNQQHPLTSERKESLVPEWLAGMPKKIAFVDVETTGLTDTDRIVSFGGILLNTAAFAENRFSLKYIHLICDPGRQSHPGATRAHGYSDWLLRHQEAFSENVPTVLELMGDAELIVAHNADFDVSFINRELIAVGQSALEKPTYCTMRASRQRGFSRAGLDAAANQIGLARCGEQHSALEDAWLAMMLYLWLQQCPCRFPFSAFENAQPKNLQPAPPVPAGRLPRRKKVPSIKENADHVFERMFEDDNLQIAWELFQKKDYETALAHALESVTEDESQGKKDADGLGYELSCMILRRKGRLEEERTLLWRYFQRKLGSDITAEKIVALAVPPWGNSATARTLTTSRIPNEHMPVVSGYRPHPAVWEMAARYIRVVERLEKESVIRKPNEG